MRVMHEMHEYYACVHNDSQSLVSTATGSPRTFVFAFENAACKDSYKTSMSGVT